MQHGQSENFLGKLRDEGLRVSWFGNWFEVRKKMVAWRDEYNRGRPHSSLGNRTSEEFAREMAGEKGCGKDGGCAPLENAARFPLSHNHDGDALLSTAAVGNSNFVV